MWARQEGKPCRSPAWLGSRGTKPIRAFSGIVQTLTNPRPARPLPTLDPSTQTHVPSLCDPALVLRAVLLVQGALAMGALVVSPGLREAWIDGAGAAAQSLPVLLVWLLSACAAQRAGLRLSSIGALALLQAWAALCAAGMSWLWQSWVAVGVQGWRVFTAGLLAAVFAGVFLQWLRSRAHRALPVAQASRLIELQARIRPHFLFNTLNTALALVRIEPAKAETLLENLAELFRAGLGPKDDLAPVTLGEELELARRYLEIEQLRFGPRLRLTWDLDPQAEGARVPRLMLQPLLENAVRHGVEPSRSGAEVRVVTRARHGAVTLTVSNSLPDEPSSPGQGMALNNVRERLSLMHDLAADLRTVRSEDRFRVEITLPAV